MAHNIYDGKMFCVGGAWHDEGVRVNEAQTSEQVINIAKLNYEIIKTPIFTEINGQKITSDYMATLNTENNKILGIVTDRYKIVQNTEAFSFFDEVVKTGEAIYESAGALGFGERIWILAKLPKNKLVFNNIDVVENYIVLTNCHDGKGSLLMYYTPIRVVCQNTLVMSLKNQTGDVVSIRHKGDIKSKISEAQRVLGLALDFSKEFEKLGNEMINTKLTISEVDGYVNRVLKIDTKEEVSTRQENIKSEIMGLYRNGKGNNIDGVKDTVWTAYNAVTEYTDHYKTVRGEKRLQSIVFGSGADLKKRAWAEAVELVTV